MVATFSMGVNAGEQKIIFRIPSPGGGGGLTTIYAGTGCAILWSAFYQAENKFWAIIFGKIISNHKLGGFILET